MLSEFPLDTCWWNCLLSVFDIATLHFSEKYMGEQGWRSGESARLPPLWPGFDSRTRRHMWVEFVVGSLPCSEGFSPGSPVSSLHKNQHSKFQFDPEMRATGLSALLLSATRTK